MNAPNPLEGTINTMTDAKGQVTIGGLTVGPYAVTVQSAGFVGQRGARGQTAPTVGAQASLSPDSPEGRIVFPMAAGAVIEGRLLDAAGRPVANARASLARMGYQDGVRGLVQATATGSVQTDAEGKYSFTTGPGEYFVRMENRGFQTGRLFGESVVYYPGVTSVSLAKPLQVNNGDRLSGMDITVPAAQGVTISGTVINNLPGGRSVGAVATGAANRIIASVYLVPRVPDALDLDIPLLRNMASPNRNTPDVSPFEMRGVPPGEYDFYPLFLDDSAGTPTYFTGRTRVSVRNTDLPNVTVTLRPQTTLKGSFVAAGELANIPWDRVRVWLRPAEVLPTLVRAVQPITVNATTREFSVAVTQSVFHVLIDGLPPAVYVADIRQGGRSIYGQPIDTNDAEIEPLEIVLRSDGATVEGTVDPASATTRAFILLRPAKQTQNPQPYKRMWTTTVEPDRFNITGIRPGDYVLYALSGPPAGGAEEDEDFMKRYEGQGVPVTVAASRSYQMSLTRIDDPSLTPVPAAQLSDMLPEITNRIARSPDTPIIAANTLLNSQGGARGARGFASAAAPAAGARPRGSRFGSNRGANSAK
jgi:hypothetical protein